MASKVRIRWRHGALHKIRSAPKVVDELEDWAGKVAATANRMGDTDGYKTSSRQGAKRPQGRWRTTVITANAKAMRDNMKRNTLTKALFSEKP
jgi:hypothetical protein